MHGFTLDGWDNFLVASAGAAAGMAGLLFVALSINLGKILETPGMAGRAGETFLPLAVILILSLLGLVPRQPVRLFGLEMIVLGGPAWLATTVIQYRALRRRQYQRPLHLAVRVWITQPATFTVLLAGLSLVCGFSGGLYWLIPATCFSFAGAVMNAWVLLVEILR